MPFFMCYFNVSAITRLVAVFHGASSPWDVFRLLPGKTEALFGDGKCSRNVNALPIREGRAAGTTPGERRPVAEPLHVLIIEDSEMDAELLLHELRRGGYDLRYRRVDTAPELEEALQLQGWDVILADYMLPQFSAPAALTLINSKDIDLPFIIVSGKIGEDIAVESLKAGAHDFIVKGNLARLIPAIERERREVLVRRQRRQAEEALQKLSSAVEQTADSVIITGCDGIIEYVNTAFERLTGYTADEVVGETPRILRSGKHDRAFYEELWGTITGRRVFRTEFVNRRKNGELYYLEEIITPIVDIKGKITHFVSTGRDITERKLHEERIARQFRRLAALRDIDRAITANLDLGSTLQTILARVTEQLQIDAAAVRRVEPDKPQLTLLMSHGFHDNDGHHQSISISDCFAGRVVLDRRALILPVVDQCPVGECGIACRLFSGDSFKAYFAVPLLAKGGVEGILEVVHRQQFVPDSEWLEFLETLAGQVAIAIDNASLFDNLQRSNRELSLAYDTTLEGWSKALDLRDQETEGHAQRVTDLTVMLAQRLGLSEEEIIHVRRGALLHDIGKMGIPDGILRKPGPLSAEEWEVMRKHPVYAYILLKSITYILPAIDIPYCHHEKWDGSGYPRGLKEEEIPLAARIFAVVDVWDALCSDRPYRKGWDKERVRDYLRTESGSQFDPRIVETFLAMVTEKSPVSNLR